MTDPSTSDARTGETVELLQQMIRNRDQLVAAKETVMNPRLREVVAESSFEAVFVRDKGMMLGDGAVWITPSKTGFGLGAITFD